MSIARQFFREMRPLFRMLDEPFSRPSIYPSVHSPINKSALFQEMFSDPAVDVLDQGDKFLVQADLPGIPKDSVNVRVGNNGRSLTIEGRVTEKNEHPAKSGTGEGTKASAGASTNEVATKSEPTSTELSTERLFIRNMQFSRTIWLPCAADPKGVTAKLADGVLTIDIKKPKEETESTVIPVQ